MSELKNLSGDKKEIIEQIGDLSKLLGMIPSDDTASVNDPVSHNSIKLSKWFKDARSSFLKLSALIDKELDLNLY